MSLVLKSGLGNATPSAHRVGADSTFGVSPPAAAPLTSPAPLDLSHLLPCRHCGAMNGRAVSACWSCEGELSAVAPPKRPDLPALSDEIPGAASQALAHANEPRYGAALGPWGDGSESRRGSLDHALSTTASDSRTFAESEPGHYLASMHLADTVTRPRRRRMIFISVAALSVVGILVSLYFGRPFSDTQYPALEPNRGWVSDGAAVPPQPITPPETGPAATPPAEPARPQAAARGVVDARPAEALGLAAATTVAAPAQAARPPAARARQRAAAVTKPKATRTAALATPAPRPERPPAARPTPAPLGPCTATVEALGLCAAPRKP